MQNKVVVKGKVQKQSNRKFKIDKDKADEREVDIDIEEDGDYEVEKLSIEGLPTHMHDGNPIHWFNNFAVKKNGQYINQRYKVKIAGLSRMAPSRLVIFDGNGKPYYYTGDIIDDTFEMTDGDPGVGGAP
jgi:hypothetical protein